MGRKSKNNTAGHLPMTHHERSHKFASSEYGTVTQRVAGEAQYQLGDCGLGLSSLYHPTTTTSSRRDDGGDDDGASSSSPGVLCTPSGYLYAADAILAYLLQHTQALKKQRADWEAQQQAQLAQHVEQQKAQAKRAFDESQKIVPTAKRSKTTARQQAAKDALKHTSYWLAEAQPEVGAPAPLVEPPARPASPHSGQALRRKDLWPVQLDWTGDDDDDDTTKNDKETTTTRRPLCSVSHKVLHSQAVVAYWTTSKPYNNNNNPGRVVLQDVYDALIVQNGDGRCPHTGQKIKVTRQLQRGGTSFSASGQAVETKRYRPTIT